MLSFDGPGTSRSLSSNPKMSQQLLSERNDSKMVSDDRVEPVVPFDLSEKGVYTPNEVFKPTEHANFRTLTW